MINQAAKKITVYPDSLDIDIIPFTAIQFKKHTHTVSTINFSNRHQNVGQQQRIGFVDNGQSDAL
jgi:beta-glucanase (GH16 family)